MSTTRDGVLAAAQRLFAERGYQRVSIRQIAAEAGVSPAMVMKVGGSKQTLYSDATPPEPDPLDPSWPRQDVGTEMVRRIVSRRDSGAVEPWMQALLSAIDSPDPAGAREAFRDHYIVRLQARLGDSTSERAEMVSAMLIGLAAAVRPLRLLEKETDWITEHYGSMIQSVIDD